MKPYFRINPGGSMYMVMTKYDPETDMVAYVEQVGLQLSGAASGAYSGAEKTMPSEKWIRMAADREE